ncbi:protein translocase subunit SecD [Ketobacter sp. MCCC 1A13808]|uniref:protein translocase subunit SecD n=1 Tax=Ketobacter sp. MCCC 1A13808 TaxID=2602738 RepID=UPI000F110CD6|nr:protein translocase subunit SecD [Ketobacter sp. MCCC 1A13808]MVF14556.1 protein translocase subunit SecD [Ketobacter sp. MCCC 1A13808]RLP54166.1 MAG: protein translocase subunit SecD [Ketobacter sp.]
MNKYPLWKNLVVLVVALFGLIYALPNLYPDDPALQITAKKAGEKTSQEPLDRAVQALEKAGIEVKRSGLLDDSALIRFNTIDDQINAKEVVQDTLHENYVVAMNLAPNTPGWLKELGAAPIKLGLDLRGGVHFLMEVDMEKATQTRLDNTLNGIRDRLREERIRYKQASREDSQIRLSFTKSVDIDAVRTILRSEFKEFLVQEEEADNQTTLMLSLSEQSAKDIKDYAISQNLTSLRNRVNELGVAEPVVQRQGADRIVIQLPGIQDTAEAKRIIGRAANLEFRLVDWENDPLTRRAPIGSEFLNMRGTGQPVLLKKDVIVTGDRVINANTGFDENGRPQVNIELDTVGGRRMLKQTSKHVKDSMAVVFIELEPEKRKVMEGGVEIEKIFTKETREVINVATIQSSLGSSFRITGLDSPAEAKELSLLLRAGALAAPMYFVEERTVGPSLGQQNIKAGLMSLVAGFSLVMLFMIAYYKLFGLIANTALLMNLLLLVAIMSIIPGATLSLPGMAGIVLTVGMAVDANVLIFARIKEEMANGVSPHAAINAGYDRAFLTILDANITTLLVGLVLFAFGSGPVKGFAVTLSIGILTSMFTAIVGTRAIVNLIYGGRALKKLSI